MASKGLEAITTGGPVRVGAQTDDVNVDDAGIDQWELKASRRALANLRTLLYGQPMIDLLQAQIDEADSKLTQYLAESDGKYTGTRVVLTVEGLKIEQFIPVLRSILGAAAADDDEGRRKASIDFLFPTHPEHYSLPIKGVGVIETMGGIPTRSFPAFAPPEEVPDFVSALIDKSYDISMTGKAGLEDGTIFTYVLQEYKDTLAGMEVSLRIWYPAACPPEYVKEHSEHYAVEFRNGCRMAAAALPPAPVPQIR
ncbi:hypothetical protein FR943_14795 [Mycobacterium sp. TNTM28]|uniref:Uncharacterized protein n=1 Tax=[Mycobacterium] fortunisiensis TaxID=2600579 RepID=A0ABS6KNG4_9MYCO|nr:hypothetical protein [[Mycobacterium] fortunisiensis]MBU9765106.1 hypothetical protein [[Mycobacterium] fortunisiensis]